MVILTITPEQLAEWRDRWIKVGFSTEPADFERAEKAALKAYALCNLERPKIILRMGSPYGAIVGGGLAWLMLRGALPRLDQKIARQIPHQVMNPVDYQIRRQMLDWHLDEVNEHVLKPIRWQVWDRVGEQVLRQVGRRVSEQVRQTVWRQVSRQIGHQADRKISLRANQQTALDMAKEGNYGGAFWVSWCAYATFMRDVLGWNGTMLARLTIEEDLATSCGWVWWHKDVLAIGDRPSEIHLDEEGRLHSEQGPSIAYRDGWKLYHIHGVAVPAFVAEQPESITVAHIENELDIEVRRVMIARMGLERFIRESGLKPIHSDDFGTLYRKEMPGDEPLVVVKVVNSTVNPDGSRKEYFLRVPPTMRRAREAVAWTFGMEEKEYRPATET